MAEYSQWQIFGLSLQEVQERLDGLRLPLPPTLSDPTQGVVTVTLPQGVEDAKAIQSQAATRLGIYVYSTAGQTLAERVVELLKKRNKTVATAESCTGGLVAAALTDVPGSSSVFGTGVVSYSVDCKQRLLGVDKATLQQHGAVSAQTAAQMAAGVRKAAGAHVGLAVTGEAGPIAGEDKPVGTVYIALADARRTWVKELHLEGEGRDRQAIRRLAAAHLLDLLRRYLEAFPAVMAGGVLHRVLDQERTIPQTKGIGDRRWWLHIFPRREDSLRRLALKIIAYVLILTVMLGAGVLGYFHLQAPDNNRLLQNSLGEIYWGGADDLTNAPQPDVSHYPVGMIATFRGLYDQNPQVAGWIRIMDTAVDYPVMQYADGYYKNHSFEQQYSIYGQPYFSENSVPEGRGSTLTVHGKNTGDGQMFSVLLSYRRIAYLRENPVIELNTLYDAARWEVFAVLVDDRDDPNAVNVSPEPFASQGEYKNYLEQLQERSLYSSNKKVSARDRILLLVTDGGREYGPGMRFVVAARLMEKEEDAPSYRVNYAAHTTATTRKQTTTVQKTTVEQTSTTTTVTEETEQTTTKPTTQATESPELEDSEQTEKNDDADIGN